MAGDGHDNSGDATSTKASLEARIATQWAALCRAVDEVDEWRRLVPLNDGRTVKDHMAHVAAWEQLLDGLLRRRDGLAATGMPPFAAPGDWSVDAINAHVGRQNTDQSSADVAAVAEQAHAARIATLGDLSDGDLRRPYADCRDHGYLADDGLILGWISGSTYEHYAEHSPVIAAFARSLDSAASDRPATD